MHDQLVKKAKAFRPALFLCITLIIAIFGFSSCDSRKTIVNALDEKEANEIVVFLASKNIEASKVQSKDAGGGGGQKIVLWDIAVDSSKVTEAMAILNANGLPRRRGQHLLDLFSAGGLVPSSMQDKIRYEAGLAEQIASTIRKIDGVLDADVQLSFPEEDPLNPQATKGKVTAAVYVKHSGVLDDPNSHLVTKIRRLVASSVNGLDFENVTVISDRARFGEESVMQTAGQGSQEKLEYVKVWSVVLAKSSLERFQAIFFSLCILILLLVLNLFWFGWKLYPILKKRGGFKMLFHLSALPDEYGETEAPVTDETKDKKSEDDTKPKNEPPKGPKVQENVETQ